MHSVHLGSMGRPQNVGERKLFHFLDFSDSYYLTVCSFFLSTSSRFITRLVIKTFATTRSQDQNFSHLVSRPRPRPWSPGFETNILITRSRDQDQDLIIRYTRQRPPLNIKAKLQCILKYFVIFCNT